MKKILIISTALTIGMLFSQHSFSQVFAQNAVQADSSIKSCEPEIIQFFSDYLNAVNSHDIKKTSVFYSNDYSGSDGFNKEQFFDLLKQTWQKYPDIKYTASVKNIETAQNNARIEFESSIKASTKMKSDITKDNGTVSGQSKEILYLAKSGNGWKIATDKIISEEMTIKYGIAKNININLTTPEQIKAGEEFTSSLQTETPKNFFAFGSITSSPVTYPMKTSEEVFRQISPDLNLLERVIKANKKGLNEISSASVSFCQAQSGSYTGLDIKVSGIAVIMKRINMLSAK